jgi:hypothetical protein
MTAQERACDRCGNVRPLNDDEHCLECEYAELQCEHYVKESMLHVLETTIGTVLEYVSPGDVFECVHGALTKTGCDGAEALSTTVAKSRALYDRRVAAGSAS